MHVLHATWLLTPDQTERGHLALWGEHPPEPPAKRRGRRPKVSPYPFALDDETLGQALRICGAVEALNRPMTVLADLPSRGGQPLPSPELLVEAGEEGDAVPTLAPWQVTAYLLPPEQALRWLASLPERDRLPPHVGLGADLQFWRLAARFQLSLLARQRFVPAMVEAGKLAAGATGSAGRDKLRSAAFYAAWQPWLDDPADRKRLEQLAAAMPPICRALRLTDDSAAPRGPLSLLTSFLHTTTDACVRHWAAPLRKPTSTPARPELRWRNALLRLDSALDGPASELAFLQKQVSEWLAQLQAESAAAFRLCFRLEAPEGTVTGRDARAWQLRYLLQAADDLSLLVPADQVWRARGKTLRYLDRRFDQPQERMLAGLGKASRLFPPIEESLHTARPEAAALTTDEAYTFLRETSLLLEESGFGVLVPQWWGRRGSANRLGARLKLRPTQKQAPAGGIGGMSFERIVAVDWDLALGDETLTLKELERLAKLKMPLVQIRGRWAVLDPEQIEAAIKFWEARQKTAAEMSLPEALRLLLAQQDQVAGVDVAGVSADGWLADLVEGLRAAGAQMTVLAQPPAFQGQLRPYQQRGFSWLAFLRRWGFGACLADDMGLGKCLLGSSLIYVNGTLRTVEQIWDQNAGATTFDGEGFWAAPSSELQVNAIDRTTNCITSAPVHRLYRQRVNELLRTVRLEDGSSITITQQHKLLTNKGWTADLHPGEYVCVPARLVWQGEPVDHDLVKLLAWQLAEGYEDPRSATVRVTQSNVAVLEDLLETLRTIGWRYDLKLNRPKIVTPPHRSPDLRWSSRAYERFLAGYGYQWGRRSAEKTIPDFIMRADDQGVRAFLRNYFDAEASVVPSMASIEISSASPLLMQQLVTLLRRLGIWMRVTPKRKRATNGSGVYRTYHVGVIGGNAARAFLEEIGFGDQAKQQRLVAICAKPANTNVEGVPASELVAGVVQATRLPLRMFGMHNTVYVNGSQQFSRQSLQRVIDATGAILTGEAEERYRQQPRTRWTAQTLTALEQLDRQVVEETRWQLQELLDREVHFCRIKSVETHWHDGWVYDLEVAEHHNFVANNILCHNTAQTIAYLLEARPANAAAAPRANPALVICPTSVVGNWQREINRFAPSLRVMIHHGGERLRGEEFAAAARQHDVVISSYALARRDADLLLSIDWSDVILDEAQNIKNPGAKQTQTIRKLPAEFRIALTGTPVENRLSELWSIMHFLNPGYLGSQREFQERFAKPIEKAGDEQAAQQLRSITQPFILRRVKTDPTIIQDLPDKLEMTTYCTLTAEQATLYQAVVEDSLRQVEASEGIERRGLVLSTLLKLKQVCNHPAQFLADGSPIMQPGAEGPEHRSGKLARLSEMLEEVLAEGDRALIFTQFAEMGELLKHQLQEAFGQEVLFLHGGTPLKKRDEMVARFQSRRGPALFVLSLKAGGTGLNLTAANYVFHYDRWWNPAVENQATDRAFRIGQTRNVQVHKLVCAGTLEEAIDDLIERKKALAEAVVGTGEGWLTELSTDELRQLLTLRKSA